MELYLNLVKCQRHSDVGQCCWPDQKKGCCDTSIQIDNSFGDETIIYDFQTDENQNERYVSCNTNNNMLLGHDLIYL